MPRALALGIVCLLVGGCASTQDATPTGSPSVPPPPVASSPSSSQASISPSAMVSSDGWSATTRAQETITLDPPPPLAAYAAALDGPEESAGRIAARTDAWNNGQNAIAECMAAQGFHYTPVPANPTHRFASPKMGQQALPLALPALAENRDTVVRYGYGIQPAPDSPEVLNGEVEDPNVAHRESLSPEEAWAFDIALYGDPSNPAATGPGSCSGQATAHYSLDLPPGPIQAFQEEFLFLTMKAYRSTTEDLFAMPEVVELNREWESCMNGKGYIFEDWEAGYGPANAYVLAIRTRPDGSVGPWHHDTPTADIPVEEKSLLGTRAERVIAVADFDCREETDYLARLTALRFQSDEEFIHANKAALDQLMAAAESW